MTPEAAPAHLEVARQEDRQAEAARLVARCAQGDCEALSDLYDRFAGLLFSLIRRIVFDATVAEEVLQESFLYAWKSSSRYNPAKASVSTWLVLISRSRAIDRLRRMQLQDRVKAQAEREISPIVAPVAAGSVLDRERADRVRAALAQLSPKQTQVIELSYYGGLTQREIAEKIGIPLGTVKTRIYLAIRKLRALLGPESDQLI